MLGINYNSKMLLHYFHLEARPLEDLKAPHPASWWCGWQSLEQVKESSCPSNLASTYAGAWKRVQEKKKLTKGKQKSLYQKEETWEEKQIIKKYRRKKNVISNKRLKGKCKTEEEREFFNHSKEKKKKRQYLQNNFPKSQNSQASKSCT